MPDTSERVPQEVALQTMLDQASVQIRGYTRQRYDKAFSRARELIDRVGETSQYSQVLYGLFTHYLIRAEYQSAAN